MPHAGHFIGGNSCSFHLNTHVNGYIVSTVGEYGRVEGRPWTPLGSNGELYESMVFPAKGSKYACCRFEMRSPYEIETKRYLEPGTATAGHMALVEKYSDMPKGKPRGQ